MLGPKPRQSAADPPRAALPNPRSVAAATAEMMWAMALATTRASLASTAHGISLWSQMLRTPIGPWSLIVGPFPATPSLVLDASVTSDRAAATCGASLQNAARGAATAEATGEKVVAFARYRSSSGHAAAQVITNH